MPDEVQREPSRRHDFALCGLPILPMVLGNITLAMTPTSRRSRFTEVHCIRWLIGRAPLNVPITIPDAPRLANTSERKVWQLLREQLSEGDLLVASQRVTDHLRATTRSTSSSPSRGCWHPLRRGEGRRGSQRRRARAGGRSSPRHTKTIEPVRQVREAMYALRDFVEADPRWTQSRPRWDHVVVFPNSQMPQDFRTPRVPPVGGRRPHDWELIPRSETQKCCLQAGDRPSIPDRGGYRTTPTRRWPPRSAVACCRRV